MSKVVCFIHSCTLDIRGTEILSNLVNLIVNTGLIHEVENVFINNVGNRIDENMYQSLSSKIMITNHSVDPNSFENCTLRLMHFYAKCHPGYKILYLHTKGVTYTKDHVFYPGVTDWVDFMLYCLVESFHGCLAMLDHVDTVGCDYRYLFNGNPSHFSGNFWWATSDYVRTLSVYELKDKYDAEWWIHSGSPTFVNIHKCPYGHYENRYPLIKYNVVVNMKMANILEILSDVKGQKIFYGTEANYIEVTDICHAKLVRDGVLYIPADDVGRNEVFGDPMVGTVKHVLIGKIKYPYTEDVRFRI